MAKREAYGVMMLNMLGRSDVPQATTNFGGIGACLLAIQLLPSCLPLGFVITVLSEVRWKYDLCQLLRRVSSSRAAPASF